MAEFRGKLYLHQENIISQILTHEAAGIVRAGGNTIMSNTVVVSAARGCGKKTAIVALIMRSEIPPARPWNVYGGESGSILARGGPFWRQNLIITGAPAASWVNLFQRYAPSLRVLVVGDSKSMRVFADNVTTGAIAHVDVIIVRAVEYTINHKRAQIVDGLAAAAAGAVFARVIYANITNGNIRLFNALRNIFIGLPPQKPAARCETTIVTPMVCDINSDTNIRDHFTITAAPALQLPGIICYKVTRAAKTDALANNVRSFGAEPGVNPAVSLVNCLTRLPVGAAKIKSCELCTETEVKYITTCCGVTVCMYCAGRRCIFCGGEGTAVQLRGSSRLHPSYGPLHDKMAAVAAILAGSQPPGATSLRIKLDGIMCCSDAVVEPARPRKVLVIGPAGPNVPEMRGSAADRAAAVAEFRDGGHALSAQPVDCTGYDLEFVTDVVIFGRKKDVIIQALGSTQRIGRVFSLTMWIIDTPDDLISVHTGV